MQAQLKNTNSLWGVLLIVLGGFFLLQVTGIFGVLTTLFWSVAFAAAGAVFLYVFLTGLHTRWWAAIPGFTLLGLAATIFYDRFAPPFFSDIGGAVFLASIGAGFIAIFFTNREQWWAIIPGGALLSVAGVVLVNPGRHRLSQSGQRALHRPWSHLWPVGVDVHLSQYQPAVGIHPGRDPVGDGDCDLYAVCRRAGLDLAAGADRGRRLPCLAPPAVTGEDEQLRRRAALPTGRGRTVCTAGAHGDRRRRCSSHPPRPKNRANQRSPR